MSHLSHIYELDAILRESRYPVSRKFLEEKLECSKNTVARLIEELKNYYNAPVIYDRKQNGYCYDATSDRFELPSFWFNESELYALLAIQQLLQNIEPGLLQAKIKPLTKRIEKLLDQDDSSIEQISDRVIIHLQSYRRTRSDIFQKVVLQLIRRNKIRITYRARSNSNTTHRTVSPQRLTHYRENWYLDCWCHTREAFRSFSLDRVETIDALDEQAVEIDKAQLKAQFSSSYGIFSGESKYIAVLRFSSKQARWIVDENWHPNQRSQWLTDGRYQMEIPYHHSQELIMDILKYGAEVEVVSPTSLRSQVIQTLQETLKNYKS